jgi:hypothetical protein
MKKSEIIANTDTLYSNLMEAYEITGTLRDAFSGIGNNENQLKECCNEIRKNIYELRESKGKFIEEINKIKE